MGDMQMHGDNRHVPPQPGSSVPGRVGQGKVEQAAAMPAYQRIGAIGDATHAQTFSPDAPWIACLHEIGQYNGVY